jgi:hypothetical protein
MVYINRYVMSCILALSPLLSVMAGDTIKEVTITIEHARFKRPLYNSSYTQIGLVDSPTSKQNHENDQWLPIVPNLKEYNLANYEDFAYVVTLQSEHKDELPQYPIILLSCKKEMFKIGAYEYAGVLPYNFQSAKGPYLICIMQLGLYTGYQKKQYIGHELGHLRDLSKYGNPFAASPWGFAFHQVAEPAFLAAADLTFVGLHMLGIKSNLLMCLAPYLICRTMGYIKSRQSHQNELDCDRFSIKVGKTPEEKIALVNSWSQGYLHSYVSILSSFIEMLLFSKPHNIYMHIREMKRIIAQQEAIIKNRAATIEVVQ